MCVLSLEISLLPMSCIHGYSYYFVRVHVTTDDDNVIVVTRRAP